jgi:short-subunit dehydrogenase involved in D-alanine esterification of teichoic acids
MKVYAHPYGRLPHHFVHLVDHGDKCCIFSLQESRSQNFILIVPAMFRRSTVIGDRSDADELITTMKNEYLALAILVNDGKRPNDETFQAATQWYNQSRTKEDAELEAVLQIVAMRSAVV